MTLSNPTLAIESVLGTDTRDTVLAHFPHLRGATVADLLDMAAQADYGLDRTEPAMDAWGSQVAAFVSDASGVDPRAAVRLTYFAALAFVLAGETPAEDRVRDLACHAAQRVAVLA